MNARKRSPHFWSGGETHLFLNIMKDLVVHRFLGYATVEAVKVNRSMEYAHIHLNGTITGIFI